MSSIEMNECNFTNEMISEKFIEYINIMGDIERHTDAACKEVVSFDKYCEETFPGDTRKQTETYERMMDVAVEFEESGFIAGFRVALDMLKEIAPQGSK